MKKAMILLTAAFILAGCHGAPFTLPQQPEGSEGKAYEVIGKTEGSASGFLLFTFIPIMKNDMIQRAYEEALSRAKGDVLMNPAVDEYWYWTPLGNVFRVDIAGTALKKK